MNIYKGSAEVEPDLLSNQFKLDYAPHLGMFENIAGDSYAGQIEFMSEAGFRFMEDNWYFDRPEHEQDEIAEALQKYGVKMATFLGMSAKIDGPTLTTGDKTIRKDFLKQVEQAVTLAKKTKATYMTMVSGYTVESEYHAIQQVNLIESLQEAAQILEPQGLVYVIEATNFINRPGMFTKSVTDAYAVCKAVNSPAIKVLFDIFHVQRQSGNILDTMDEVWDEVAYIQSSDAPKRLEPTTGELNFKNIFKHIYEKGYQGIIGMEHGNSLSGIEGDKAVIRAYQECDDF